MNCTTVMLMLECYTVFEGCCRFCSVGQMIFVLMRHMPFSAASHIILLLLASESWQAVTRWWKFIKGDVWTSHETGGSGSSESIFLLNCLSHRYSSF
jgi:hypothetical protein